MYSKRTASGLVLKKCLITVPCMGFVTMGACCFHIFEPPKIGMSGKFQPGKYIQFGNWAFNKQFINHKQHLMAY